ncbi:hypothetical protein T484DRAFT_1927012 [Baffinella frigidus]|nr:hypothetical protein T484DRAFT_1927012 [Cryptophyta sp. CCMP2293]
MVVLGGGLFLMSERQRRTCYALCHLLYPVSAAHTSIFRMDSNSTSYPMFPDHMNRQIESPTCSSHTWRFK